MPRDQRFVAVHRGGPLSMTDHRLLASWAADCAERVLGLFGARHPGDDRPRSAIETARAWSRGEVTVGTARAAALEAHAAARTATDPAAKAAARAAGHAVATAHMADHSVGAAAYAVRAVKASVSGPDAVVAAERERVRQHEMLPPDLRALVVRNVIERKSG